VIEALRRLPPGVGRIGLGLAALGRPGYIDLGHAADLSAGADVASMQANAFVVLDAAYASGVRYFDAARSYGKAEEFLGAWLTARGLSPDQVSVGSKWGYTYTAGWRVDAEVHEVKDLTLDTLRRQYAESRHNLGDNLQLYQIHSATLESGVLDDPPVVDELARLRSGGLGIGLSTSGPRQHETIERALEVGGFDAVQATYNLLETSAASALAAAHQAGLTVIIKEAVANGRLTGRGDVAALAELARDAELALDQLALAAVLAQPWVDVVLSGASTQEVLASNLMATSIRLSPEQLDRLSALRETPESYWETRSALPWN
jgi:aryl-alcohol dehydrogenase-like predicted oxidoreductase